MDVGGVLVQDEIEVITISSSEDEGSDTASDAGMLPEHLRLKKREPTPTPKKPRLTARARHALDGSNTTGEAAGALNTSAAATQRCAQTSDAASSPNARAVPFPSKCIVCNALVDSEHVDMCNECVAFATARDYLCPVCSGATSEKDQLCQDCAQAATA